MKRILNSNVLTMVVTTLLSVAFIWAGSRMCATPLLDGMEEDFCSAKVVELMGSNEGEKSLGGSSSYSNKNIYFNAKLTSGYRKGSTLQMTQLLDEMYAYQPRQVEVGDEIIVSPIVGDSNQLEWMFVEHNRSGKLFWLVIFFFALIILIGRGKGVATLLSLIMTTAVIFMVYVPSILSGYNVYLSTTIIAIFIILMSLVLINGCNKKTLCAVLGNIGGVLVAGMLALLMSNLLSITGMIDVDYIMLTFISEDFVVDLRAIIWGGIVIGSLGAVMDVAMSIASAMNELSDTMRDRSFAGMVRSGMNIGRDAIGTMTNTLILAYIGGSLATVLLMMAYNNNLLYLMNMEMIVVEILQAVVGSIGILFAVPSTVFISAYMFTRTAPLQLPEQPQ